MSAFLIRDQRRTGWFSLDNEIIDEHGGKIGAYGVAVYCAISRHSRNQIAKLSQRDIATSLGISQDRVRKSLADLVDLNLVHVDVPDRVGPGLITTITLLDVKSTERHTFSSTCELNATRSRNKERKNKTETKPIPPTPLFQRGAEEIWQKVCGYLKDDLSDAFVKTAYFEECAYDKYFRDASLVEIRNDVAILDSNDPGLLEQGVEKFQKRLRDTFHADGCEIRSIRVRTRSRNADSASQSNEACNLPFEKSGRGSEISPA
jgi:hypothetical protein